MARADSALRFAVRFIEELERRTLTTTERLQVSQAIEYGHAELSRQGVLGTSVYETSLVETRDLPAASGAALAIPGGA